MTEKWTGKIAIVTGASSGIGTSIFKYFVKAGIVTIGLARRVDKIEEILKELGAVEAYAYKCDISDPKSIAETFKKIKEKFGVVHIIVNNAGCGRNTPILDDQEESFKKLNEIFDTNVRGLIQCSREAYRMMTKADVYGMIIHINSISGHKIEFAKFTNSCYDASKFAVTALTETMRQEIINNNNDKVRVASVSPGYVKTEFGAAAGRTMNEFSYDNIPHLSGNDVSQAVMYLLSTPYNVNVTELIIRPVGEKF